MVKDVHNYSYLLKRAILLPPMTCTNQVGNAKHFADNSGVELLFYFCLFVFVDFDNYIFILTILVIALYFNIIFQNFIS